MYMKSGGAPPLHPTALHTPATGKVRTALVAPPPPPSHRVEAPKIKRGIWGVAAPETLCSKSLDCQNRGPDAPQRP